MKSRNKEAENGHSTEAGNGAQPLRTGWKSGTASIGLEGSNQDRTVQDPLPKEALQELLKETGAGTTQGMVGVRSYLPEDYPAVLTLWEQAKLRAFTAMEIERLLASGGGALVAVWENENADNDPVAAAGSDVVGVVLWSHNGNMGMLWRLAVAESARGLGIATLLLDRAEQDIRLAGFSGVTLLTRVSNSVAKGMYSRRGYRWNDQLEFWGKKLG